VRRSCSLRCLPGAHGLRALTADPTACATVAGCARSPRTDRRPHRVCHGRPRPCMFQPTGLRKLVAPRCKQNHGPGYRGTRSSHLVLALHTVHWCGPARCSSTGIRGTAGRIVGAVTQVTAKPRPTSQPAPAECAATDPPGSCGTRPNPIWAAWQPRCPRLPWPRPGSPPQARADPWAWG